MDLKDIQNLIRFVAKSGASEVKLEMEDVKITIKTSGEEGRPETVFVQQPYVAQGLPQTHKPLLVEIGDNIVQGQTLCVIEAMKLFNEIESEVSGKIVKVLVDDASPVEYDQPLFLVDPS